MISMRVMGAAALAALLAGTATGQAQQARPTPAERPATLLPAGDPQVVLGRRLLASTATLFDGYVRDGKMPGIVGAFGVGDAPTVFVAAGAISADPGASAAGPDSLWRIYSMTKPITAMAAMILIEEGKLGLDDPLDKYFPSFRNMRVLTSPDTSLASRPAKNRITIRNLLTHTAGLGYNIINKGPIKGEYDRLGILPGVLDMRTEAQAKAARPKSLAAFADRVATLPLVYEPGTKWSYSIGLDVLAAVVEKASGMPFEAFVKARLLTPLRMDSTFWQVPRGEVGRFATNYVFVGDSLTPIDPGRSSVYLDQPSFPYGGAGLVSSARDYDRFLHMLQAGGTLDGVRVMKPETAALAMSNLLPAGVFFEGIGQGTGGNQAGRMGYGAGGSVYLQDVPGGASKGTYGWGGAAGTIAWVDPARRMRGTVMVNYMPPDRWPTRAEIPAALAQDAARLHGR